MGHLHIQPWLTAVFVGQWTPEWNYGWEILVKNWTWKRVCNPLNRLYLHSMTIVDWQSKLVAGLSVWIAKNLIIWGCNQMANADDMQFWNLGNQRGTCCLWFFAWKSPSSEYIDVFSSTFLHFKLICAIHNRDLSSVQIQKHDSKRRINSLP